MRILITGAAGFIGSQLAVELLARGDTVFGIDNHNDYYDPSLKEARLARHGDHNKYRHFRVDISEKEALDNVFEDCKPQKVVNLAAQAGVRFSIDNPNPYIQSNIVGFANILEACRRHHIQHLVFASSSSVYGANLQMPFSVRDNVDHCLSLYAASKRSNELLAHTYSHLYGLPATGLRFFTVYGPWGRPDMALFKFTNAILKGTPIQLFNFGNHRRDFTYIDDIVSGVIRVIDRPAQPNNNWQGDKPDPASSIAPWRIYNIGNSHPVELMDFVSALEEVLGKKAHLEMVPIQAGDVPDTFADISDFITEFNYKPSTTLHDGISKFVEWHRVYFSA